MQRRENGTKPIKPKAKRQIDPTGRLDILATRVADRYLEGIEQQLGVGGIRDFFNPHIKKMVKRIPKRVEEIDDVMGFLKKNPHLLRGI
jgi:hypothetical protein